MANLTITAGTGAAKVGDIIADTVGTITVKSTSSSVSVSKMTFADTSGVTVSIDAGTTIGATTDADTVKNTKGDLSVTLKAAGLISATGATMKFEAGTAAVADIDIVVDASAVVGAVAATGDNMIVTNGATDSASSTIVKGGAAANFVTIATAATAAGTVTYYGQTLADTVTVTGNAAATIYAEAGADVIVGGDGADTIYAGADTDTITGGKGNDTIVLTETTAVADDIIFSAAADNGVDTITGFTSTDTFRVAALGATGVAAGSTAITAANTAQALTDNNSIVISTNGTAANLTTSGTAVVTDWTNMTQVAAYLDERFTNNASVEEEQVFVINDTTTGANKTYIISYDEGATNAAWTSTQLTLVGVISNGGTALVDANIDYA